MHVGLLKFGYQYALKSPEYPFKLACIIFKGKRILSAGYNEVRCCSAVPSKYKKFPESLHAEVAALIRSKKNALKGASAFICRVNASSKRISSAKCCVKCQEMLYDYGIKKVFCTNDYGLVDEYLLRPSLEFVEDDIKYDRSAHDYSSKYLKYVIND